MTVEENKVVQPEKKGRKLALGIVGGLVGLIVLAYLGLCIFVGASNVVLPGTIKTARWVSMGNKQIVNGELTPIGDISDFEDIANAVWYFASDASKNTTGAELVVDGGMLAQLTPNIERELWKEH